MKLSIRRVIATFAVSFAAALLMLASSLSAQGQANSVVAPPASGEAQSAGSGAETAKPAAAATGKPAAHKAAPAKKKKKSSFMNKMRDKAKQQVQKLLGSKPESKQQ